MKGFIKITATDEGIQTHTEIQCSKFDKLLLLDSFARGLNMDDDELKRALLMLPLVRGLRDIEAHKASPEGGDE